jgi:hypothetical protein
MRYKMTNPNFFVYTFSMGRWDYLEKCILSVAEAKTRYTGHVRHIVFLQGVTLPNQYKYLSGFAEFIENSVNHGIAISISNSMKYIHDDEVIMKCDDDCKLIGNHFFEAAGYIANSFPSLVFSPFPVGLINNLGGSKMIAHEVHHWKNRDKFLTFRRTEHIGGLCRISPNITRTWTLLDDKNIAGFSGNEDIQFAKLALLNNMPMAYLENELIVEHQESTLGQHARYGSGYFNERF